MLCQSIPTFNESCTVACYADIKYSSLDDGALVRRATIGKNVIIHPSVQIQGGSRIGDGVTITPCTVIDADAIVVNEL
jgi:UDP-3-O-[3-hydroxymyristoyl] glucosamine N-acyltransferase